MSKKLAVLFSDLHISEWPKFNINNQRTLNHFRVLSRIKNICIKESIPAIFLGDMFHVPQAISNSLLDLTLKKFKKLDSEPWTLYAISGNHDMSKENSFERPSPSLVKSLSRVFNFLHCIDFQTVQLEGFTLTGIPYIDHNVGVNHFIKSLPSAITPHILLMHTDFPGAVDTDGSEVGTTENLNVNLLKPFKRVFVGHIHKPQQLSKRVYMIGAPLQQRRTDRDCELGYWILYDDFSMEFHPFDFPRFIDVETEDEIKDDGNYYTVVAKAVSSKSQMEVEITKDMSPQKIVRKYLRAIGESDPDKKNTLIKLIANEV